MSTMIHVPATAKDMLDPKPATVITEASNFLRVHWEDIKPFFQSISGEIESKHGSLMLDEAACVFEVQRIARDNGYAFLGTIQTAKLKRVLRYAYRRNTGMAVKYLEQQYRRLRIERRQEAQSQ